MDFLLIFSGTPWFTIGAGAVILILVLGCWVLFLNRVNPTLTSIDEPDAVAECTLASAYVGDVDIAHLLLQYLVDDLEATALKHTQEEQDDNY